MLAQDRPLQLPKLEGRSGCDMMLPEALPWEFPLREVIGLHPPAPNESRPAWEFPLREVIVQHAVGGMA